jgi:RNA polymerase sigma-70 factor (ECF subfamily)
MGAMENFRFGPSVEELLTHRLWVRRIARHLVRDDSLADDLEQETWLAALTNPPRHATSVRGWLATVLRRTLKRGRRGDGRRRALEERASSCVPASEPPAADLVALAEEHERVVRAVLDLEEPFRTALLLRFFEDLPPREIARRTGVPPETVRSRVRRGLERIRERFDREHGGDRRAWLASMAVLGGRAGEVPAPGSGAGTAVGVLAMSTAAKSVAAAAVLAGLLAYLAFRGGEAPSPGMERASTTRTPVEGTKAPEEAAARAGTPLPIGPAPGGAAPETRGGTLVRLILHGAGRLPEGWKGVRAEAWREDLRESKDFGDRLRLLYGLRDDADLESRVEEEGSGPILHRRLSAGHWRLLLVLPDRVTPPSETVQVDGTGEVSVAIDLPEAPPSVRIRAVVPENGTVLVHASVRAWIGATAADPGVPGPGRETDVAGEVDLPLLGAPGDPETAWWIEAPGRAGLVRESELRAHAGSGEPGPLCVQVPATARVEGRAWTAEGDPAVGRIVAVRQEGRVAQARVDGEGRYSIDGVAVVARPVISESSTGLRVSLGAGKKGSGSALVALIDEGPPTKMSAGLLAVVPGETAHFDLGRPREERRGKASLHGRLTAGGEPLGGVLLLVTGADGQLACMTDADGRWKAEEIAPGPVEVGVYTTGSKEPGIRSNAPFPLAGGEDRTVDLDLPGGVLEARVVDDLTGEPVAGAVITAALADGTTVASRFPGFEWTPGGRVVTGKAGQAFLRGLPLSLSLKVGVEKDGYVAVPSVETVAGPPAAPGWVEMRLRRP